MEDQEKEKLVLATAKMLDIGFVYLCHRIHETTTNYAITEKELIPALHWFVLTTPVFRLDDTLNLLGVASNCGISMDAIKKTITRFKNG